MPQQPAGVTNQTHLYVSTGSAIQVFTLPLTASSTPVASVTTPSSGMAINATQLFAASNGSTTVSVFNLPLTTSSTPAFSMTVGTHVEDVKLDSNGRLFAAVNSTTTCCVDVLTPPLSAASTPAFTLNEPSGGGYPWGVAFDPSGNLFVAGGSTNDKFAPPIASGSTAAATFGPNYDNYGINSDSAGRIFVANGTADGELDVYTPPVITGSTRSFALTVSTNYIGYPAFDNLGNLYVPVYTDNKLYVYTAPITSASTPAFSVPLTHAYGAVAVP